MELTNQKVVTVQAALKRYEKATHIKLNHAFGRCRHILKPYAEPTEDAKKPLPKIEEYTKKRIELCTQYAEKEVGGRAKMVLLGVNPAGDQVQEFVIPEKDKEAFEKALEDLRASYKDDLDQEEQRKIDFQELLDEKAKNPGSDDPADIIFYSYPISKLPGYKEEEEGKPSIYNEKYLELNSIRGDDFTLFMEVGILRDDVDPPKEEKDKKKSE